MIYHWDCFPLGIEHVLIFVQIFNAVFVADWTGRVKQNYPHPFPVFSASAADGVIAHDGGCVFHLKQVKFPCYVEAVTHDILSSITEIKSIVNSKSEMILFSVFMIGCYCHVSFIMYICLNFN